MVGTTILGLLNREGILIAGDSMSWKLKAKQANPRNEIKVHRIGGDPGYILLAISGSNFMTDHVLVTLRNLVNEEHKKGRVMTSGGCARDIYNFLNTDLNELEASSYNMPKDVDYNTFECGVLVAMFEPDLRNVCAVRRPGLYLASAEDWDKINEFEIDGAGYEKAFDAISPSYAYDKEMEDAIVQVEEGMLAASKSGGSGGIITID